MSSIKISDKVIPVTIVDVGQFIRKRGTKADPAFFGSETRSVYHRICEDTVSDQHPLLAVEGIYGVDILKTAVDMIVALVDNEDLHCAGGKILIVLNA
ncbi:hypothetical protein [Mucilaginibacter pedocola]|uniref:Uncharacterized protein n=1 Tax=Mucilaginibacter pedocola TaxID=1792845 RepID=A0A1S9PA23_9SPHI|nr:hypothetical protein [Mucilaginibacter pedocola]OOQ57836.1 hypothetical protein BC343_13735 [Mucilaginibacter pedocola]